MILFGAGEDEQINTLNGGMEQVAGTYDPAYARGAIRVHGNPGAQLIHFGDLKAYLDAQPEGDKDFWMSYRLRGGGGFLTGGLLLHVFDATKAFMRLWAPGVGNARLQLSGDGFASLAGDYPASDVAQPAAHQQWSFRIKVHPTLGHVEWYIDNALWFTTPNFNTAALVGGSPSKTWWSNPNSNDTTWISEIMYSTADHPLPGLRLKSLGYVAVGDLAGWNGPVGNINEFVKNPATAQSTATADVDEALIPDTIGGLADGIVVHALIISVEARTAPAPAPQHIVGGVRIAGVTYQHPTVRLVANVAAGLQWIFHKNPATTDEFTPVEIDAPIQIVHRSAA